MLLRSDADDVIVDGTRAQPGAPSPPPTPRRRAITSALCRGRWLPMLARANVAYSMLALGLTTDAGTSRDWPARLGSMPRLFSSRLLDQRHRATISLPGPHASLRRRPPPLPRHAQWRLSQPRAFHHCRLLCQRRRLPRRRLASEFMPLPGGAVAPFPRRCLRLCFTARFYRCLYEARFECSGGVICFFQPATSACRGRAAD